LRKRAGARVRPAGCDVPRARARVNAGGRRKRYLRRLTLGSSELKGGCMATRSGANVRLAAARLREIMVDPSRFADDERTISSYLEPGRPANRLICAVYPRGQVDIEHVLGVARSFDLAVYTPIPWGLAPTRTGIVMDYKFMSNILSVDETNLFMAVEPGVTWEQVLGELAGQGVRVALPAAARSPYVLESALEREVVLSACRLTNKQLSTFHVLLADGREYRSGSDALPSSVAHWREDGGPNISRVFTGSRNSFGLPLRGYLFLYPEPEDRGVVLKGLTTRKQACALAQRCARSEVATEVLVLGKAKAVQVLGDDAGLSAWSVLFGVEGSPRLVAYQKKRVDELAGELKLKPVAAKAGVLEAAGDALGRPWYAPEASFGFYTTFNRVDELSAIAEAALKGQGRLAQMIIPVKRGASVYVQFDLLDAKSGAPEKVKACLIELADAGAFFPNPTGSLATHIFKKQAAYFKTLKQLKTIMDPDNMLNSGQVVEV
jgi:FAD/FMN-containing dehydrogenase